MVLSTETDIWKSKLSPNGNFSIHDLHGIIDSKLTVPMPNLTIWLRLVPLKIIVFVWRACIDRLPSVVALARRGISVSNISCQFCNVGIDDSNHFFLTCTQVEDSLRWIFNWYSIPWQNFNSVGRLVQFAAT